MRWTTRLASLALLVFLVPPAFAAGDVMRLAVRPNKVVVAPFEPVIVSYDVENTSSEAQSVPALTDPALGWVKLEVSDRNGRFRPYRTGVQGVAGLKFVTLKPGERLSDQLIVLTNAFGRAAGSNPTEFGDVPVFPFGEPGHYKLKVTFPLEPRSEGAPRRELDKVIRITVKPSQAASDDLRRFAGVDDLAAAVGADADVDVEMAEAVPKWERIVEAAPNSVFAPFVRFNLAKAYRDGVGEASPDYTRAAAHCWAVATSGPPSLADDALVGFAESQIELGNYRAASDALNRITSDFASTNSARRATRLRDGLAKGKKSMKDILSE